MKNDGEQPVAAQEIPFKTWICVLCGYHYDESVGSPHDGIAPGTRWADVPDDWICPDCSAGKVDFEMVEI